MMKKVWMIIAVGIVFSALITLIVSGINKNDNKKYGIKQYKTGKQVVVNLDKYEIVMDVEQFIPCVLMAQLDVDSPIELLKAQAVVIRTYILYSMGNRDKIDSRELGLPFCSYTKMQEMWFEDVRREKASTGWGMFYNFTGIGKTKVYDEKMKCIHKVMEKTNGKVLKYNGKIILPLFHKISNGTTRDGEKLLGNSYKYLKPVKCESDVQEDEFISVRYFTLEEFIEKLKEKGIVIYKDNKEIFDYKESDVNHLMGMMDFSNVDDNGYQLCVKIGETTVNGDTFKDALDLRSTSMKVEEYEKGIRISTKGCGHGFGMSLSYAKYLAENGSNWGEILRKFYDCVIIDY